MSWNTQHWHQDDSVFYGYPYTTYPCLPIDGEQLNTGWKFEQDYNHNYPYIQDLLKINLNLINTGWTESTVFNYPSVQEVLSIDLSQVNTIWQFEEGINFDYPFTYNFLLFPDVSYPILMVGDKFVQNAYIGNVQIYAKNELNNIKQDNFFQQM